MIDHACAAAMKSADRGELVSIIIPCFNHEAYVETAIQSALRQSHQPCEVIVVDDGSTDGSGRKARACGPSVRVIEQANGGLAAARNTGIREAEGSYFVFLDADDWLETDAVKVMLEAMRELPDRYGVVGSRMNIADAQGTIIEPAADPGEVASVEVAWADLLISGYRKRFPCSALVRRSVFEVCGTFDAGYGRLGCEDRDMWLRAATRFRIRRLSARLLNVRTHDVNMSADPARQLPGMRRCLRKAWREGGRQRWRLLLWGKAYAFYFHQAAIMCLERGEARKALGNSLLGLLVFPLPGLCATVGIPRFSRVKRFILCCLRSLKGRGSPRSL